MLREKNAMISLWIMALRFVKICNNRTHKGRENRFYMPSVVGPRSRNSLKDLIACVELEKFPPFFSKVEEDLSQQRIGHLRVPKAREGKVK